MSITTSEKLIKVSAVTKKYVYSTEILLYKNCYKLYVTLLQKESCVDVVKKKKEKVKIEDIVSCHLSTL